MVKTKQKEQIITFLSAYPKDVVELGIEAWRTGAMPVKILDSRFHGNDGKRAQRQFIHRHYLI